MSSFAVSAPLPDGNVSLLGFHASAMRAYLSGGMEYSEDAGNSWRSEMENWISSELRHEVFNPSRKSDEFFSHRYPGIDIRHLKFQNLEQYVAIIEELVRLDTSEIAERSDYVVCYWDDSASRGAGTKGEITIAKYFSKPVYLVADRPLNQIPGWVLACATRIFSTFDEVRSFLLHTYSRNL